MSFEQHSGGSKQFAGKLDQPLEAFLVDAYVESTPNKFGNFNHVLKLKKSDGAEFDLVTVGTLAYLAKNILMHKGLIPKNDKVLPATIEKDAALIGKYIRITKTGTYKQKNTGKDVTSFLVEVDSTKTIDAVDSTASSNDIPF